VSFSSLHCSYFYIGTVPFRNFKCWVYFSCFTPPYPLLGLKSEFSQYVGLIQLRNMTRANTAIPASLPPHSPSRRSWLGRVNGEIEGQFLGEGEGRHILVLTFLSFVPWLIFPKHFVLSTYIIPFPSFNISKVHLIPCLPFPKPSALSPYNPTQ
jgi:hypothetical protein